MIQQEMGNRSEEGFEYLYQRGFEEEILKLPYDERQSQESERIFKESHSLTFLKSVGKSLTPFNPDIAVGEGCLTKGVRYGWMRWNIQKKVIDHKYIFNEVVVYALPTSQEIAIAMEGGCLVLPQDQWRNEQYLEQAIQYATSQPKHAYSYYARPYHAENLQLE